MKSRWGREAPEHECNFVVPVMNDMGTQILDLCDVCGASDGRKFWAELNDKWDFRFDTGKWIKNKIKRFINH